LSGVEVTSGGQRPVHFIVVHADDVDGGLAEVTEVPDHRRLDVSTVLGGRDSAAGDATPDIDRASRPDEPADDARHHGQHRVDHNSGASTSPLPCSR
jgi:hypothetical protein